MEALSDRDQEDLRLGRIFRKILLSQDQASSNWIDVQDEPGFPWLVLDVHLAPTLEEAQLVRQVIEHRHRYHNQEADHDPR